jgi:hypothetical protein
MFGASASNNTAAHPSPVSPAAAATPAAPAPSADALDTSVAAATSAAKRDTAILRSSKKKFSDVEVQDLPHMVPRSSPTAKRGVAHVEVPDQPPRKRIQTMGGETAIASPSTVNFDKQNGEGSMNEVPRSSTCTNPTPHTSHRLTTAGSALEIAEGCSAIFETAALSNPGRAAPRYADALEYVGQNSVDETLATLKGNVVGHLLQLYKGVNVEHRSFVNECQRLAEKKQELNSHLSTLRQEMKLSSPSINLKALKDDAKLEGAIADLVANAPKGESHGNCPDNIVKLLCAASEGLAFARQVKGKLSNDIDELETYFTMLTDKYSTWKAQLSKKDNEIAERKAKYEMELNEMDAARKKHLASLGDIL